MLHLSPLPRDILLMPPRRSQKLLVILQPRDDPLPILCWPGSMNRHLWLSVSLKYSLMFLRGMREPERFSFLWAFTLSVRMWEWYCQAMCRGSECVTNESIVLKSTSNLCKGGGPRVTSPCGHYTSPHPPPTPAGVEGPPHYRPPPWPRQPRVPCPTLPPTPYYFYIAVLLLTATTATCRSGSSSRKG